MYVFLFVKIIICYITNNSPIGYTPKKKEDIDLKNVHNQNIYFVD